MFEVYTYFGRIVSQHVINGTHHQARCSARAALMTFEQETGQKAWVRYVRA
jgi:hypothetical protein